ncbi:hypothetical protein CDD81_3177 [Ophiocordyceps australis]|uniref:Zn(2)-C6 fungal-type domain-containing protein n=1 Tax=Ophiocordyceps australis TaxID=1399860 RepID=A0A2C5XSK5_9HYPO|nr:hypothetical protein CDD81_3177 [Ophiocordyceps australis]
MSQNSNPAPRAILPAAPTPVILTDFSNIPPGANSREGNVPNSACQACRIRKCKCSREQPCEYCRSNEIECIYNNNNNNSSKSELKNLKEKHEKLQKKHDTYQDFFAALKNLSSDAGSEVLKQIRQGADVESVVRLIHSGDLVQQTLLVPESRLRHNLPRVPMMPSRLQTADNDYLNCIVFDAVFPNNQSPGAPIHVSESLQRYQTLYLRPFHTARIVEPRLERIKLSKWTTVSANDSILRSLLHDYLLHQYPTFPVFQKDIFLDAAEAGDHDLCSSLLVNALLANACQCHEKFAPCHESEEAESLGSRFLAEARRLLHMSGDVSSLPALQGCMLLHTALSSRSMNHVGYPFFSRAMSMANKLGLFTEHGQSKSKMQVARHFSAWCLFCWQA